MVQVIVSVSQMDGIQINGIDITYQTAPNRASEQNTIPTINPLRFTRFWNLP